MVSRTVREVELTDQARAWLGTTATALAPHELIRALLCAPADLLYAGGIGTFARASTETDADVADRANDAIRVGAAQLGARIVVEGANLALTPRARVEYALAGGRVNTDAIDNAAGVATSDREVNLKILLAEAVRSGACDAAQVPRILEELTGHVAAAVLRDVNRQTAAVSREMRAAPRCCPAWNGSSATWNAAAGLPGSARRSPALRSSPAGTTPVSG